MNTKQNQNSGGTNDQPTFHFFRETPCDMMKCPPLASSLQSFETCLLLISLKRYPSALVACATAWECVIKAKLGLVPENDLPLDILIREIQNHSATLRTYDAKKLHSFRKARNQIVHFGFSPKDDEECAVQLLEAGFPFLDRCYRELFDFYLDWNDIERGASDILKLSPGNMDKAGLEPDMAEQYRVSRNVFRRAKELRGLELSYCFRGLIHYLRVGLKETAMTSVESAIAERAETCGEKFDLETGVQRAAERFYKGVIWKFNCPICRGCQSVIGELDEAFLERKQVSVRRCICSSCGFMVPEGNPYLADELLRGAIERDTPKIMKELGIR